jgi:hypothetical protein
VNVIRVKPFLGNRVRASGLQRHVIGLASQHGDDRRAVQGGGLQQLLFTIHFRGRSLDEVPSATPELEFGGVDLQSGSATS